MKTTNQKQLIAACRVCVSAIENVLKMQQDAFSIQQQKYDLINLAAAKNLAKQAIEKAINETIIDGLERDLRAGNMGDAVRNVFSMEDE